jgi:hypothetical protein
MSFKILKFSNTHAGHSTLGGAFIIHSVFGETSNSKNYIPAWSWDVVQNPQNICL